MTTEQINETSDNELVSIANQMSVNVEQMTSSKGNKIANQFIIRTELGRYFQSYSSVIAFIPYGEGKTILGTDWAYSVTTGKYRNDFLREDKATTQAKIKSGEYLVNPNW